MLDLTPTINFLAEHAHALRERQERSLIAICGAPAAGKSLLSSELARRLRDQRCPVAVVPQDGFHLDNRLLDERGLMHVKGAPETFDSDGFTHLLHRIAAGGRDVVFPIFDRDRDLSVSGAGVVPADCPLVIVEGNYLLLDEDPWRGLSDLWDLSIWLDVAEEDLRARLIQRWLRLNHSRAAAVRRAEQNDLPNARRAATARLEADITL